MSAIETVESLLQLGIAVKSAYTSAQHAAGGMDWVKFMSSPEFKAIEGDVGALVGKLTKNDLDGAIAAIQAKEKALLGTRTVAQLPNDKLLQYSDLVHTESLLVNRQVASIQPTQEALSWVVDTLLPTLGSVAKVVIPLLV